MKTCMMSHVKVCSLTTYHILLAEVFEILMKLHAPKLTIDFQLQLAHPPSSWLVN